MSPSKPTRTEEVQRRERTRRCGRAFSIVEAVIAAVILGLVAALAIPNLTRAAEPPARDIRSALLLLRNAIELYAYEHGEYPGQNGDGDHEAGTEAAFAAQLTRYSDADGRTSERRTSRFRYGPYLRRGIPACPLTPGARGVVFVEDRESPGYRPEAASKAWVFNASSGDIVANADGCDETGMRYDAY